MERCRVSVIIPVYNAEKYIDRCVESVVRQSYSDLEIVLVDDGSPDNCPAICDRWAEKDERIIVIHQENSGAGPARNAGIKTATGKYVMFLDSDDYFAENTVGACIESALKNDADIVMFGHSNLNDDGNIVCKTIKNDKLVFCKDEVTKELLPGLFTYERGFGISICMKMFDLGLIKKNNICFGDERVFVSEDACFLLKVIPFVNTVSVVPENLYFYCYNDTSFTHSYKEEQQQLNNAFLKKALLLINKLDNSEKTAVCIKVRYHMYTVAALKQICGSDLSKEEKKDAILKIFRDPVLKSTLDKEVFCKDKKSIRLLFTAVKLRCYGCAYLMLKHRMGR